MQDSTIEIENYEIEKYGLPENFEGFKIVQISDLHLPNCASDSKNILLSVEQQNPDIIVITGDIIDKTADIEKCGLAEFCKELTTICSVYAVNGNHEEQNSNAREFSRILKENGVNFLDNEYAIIDRGGQQLSIIGLSNGVSSLPLTENDIENIKDTYKIILEHRPDLFDIYSSKDFGIKPDLVLSGHAHGGQFIFPLIGAVYAPDQGLFPKYTSGIYKSENGATMIVSRGIGDAIVKFRFNNRRHMPVIKLQRTLSKLQ